MGKGSGKTEPQSNQNQHDGISQFQLIGQHHQGQNKQYEEDELNEVTLHRK
jgi:hypothetical protein